jgi:Excalibur calcium-binding domain
VPVLRRRGPADHRRARPGGGPGRTASVLAAVALTAAVVAACTSTTTITTTSQQGVAGTPSAITAGPESALSTLYSLAVADLGPTTGYRPQQFGPRWADTDHNGCDTLDDVLRRDLTGVEVRGGDRGCVVLSGALVDPYTGTRARYARRTGGEVAVDHVVSLLDAWRTGMRTRPPAERLAFANDPMNLYTVTRTAYADKNGADAASWLPPAQDFRCTYVAAQVGVKKKYGLWVTSGERVAMERVLMRCPNLRAPSGGSPTTAYVGATRAPASGTGTPTPTATATPDTPTPHRSGSHAPPRPPSPPAPAGSSAPPPTSAAPSPPPTSGPPDPRFNNCAQARAHGYGPYYFGRDVEYFWYPDTDLDGVVCE